MATETLVAVVLRINVRSEAKIGDNVIGFIYEKQQVVVEKEGSVTTEDGWVWRKIAGPIERWISEKNTLTNVQLLRPLGETEVVQPSPTPTSPPPTETETPYFKVTATSLTVRREPDQNAEAVQTLNKGAIVKLSDSQQTDSRGWVWRQLENKPRQWIQEFNEFSSERVLEPVKREDIFPGSGGPGGGGTGDPGGSGGPGDSGGTGDGTPDPRTASKETLEVITSLLNVRDSFSLSANIVTRLSKGDKVEVIANYTKVADNDTTGWVWRRVISDDERWVAEYNQKTNERLLEKPAVVVKIEAKGRVKTQGRGFVVDGKALRFVGANLRELPFYGQSLDPIRWADANDRKLQLEAVKAMNMKVIRFHACHRDLSADRCVELTKQALDYIHGFGVLAIVCMNDSLGDSHYYVNGDQPWHNNFGHPLGHLDKSYFKTGAYRQNYLPFVQKLTSNDALKNHPAIFAWELGNEYVILPQLASQEDSDAFVKFVIEVTQVIRNNDPNHLICTGMIRDAHAAPSLADQRAFTKKFYQLANLDFGTVHFYQDQKNPDASFALEEEGSRVDLGVMEEIGKPLIVEEFSSTAGDRKAYTDLKLQQWFGKGAAGFMQWGLSATGKDRGVGDNERGMDNYSDANRGSYDALFNLYRDWGARLRGS